ncbi:MAG: D-alanyl-D-alanine carboxypeptidase [Kiritimatiellae bacterium]|nr:D-alanyl-D-alanine carboxypeptidase [Kiritimatiellia bacterium]
MKRLAAFASVAALCAFAAFAHRGSPYVGALAADAKTGRILFEENADAEAYPASVTKLMTLLLVLEDVEAGKYALEDSVTATEDATRLSEASWVDFRPGEKMTVDDLLTALMVKSANDAAVALGVNSAGSFDAFVARMNARAAELGMTRTKYYNPNGLPPVSHANNRVRKYPWKSFNVSTCRDQMKLALELAKKPQTFKYTSQKVAAVTDGRGQKLTFVNHNNVMVKNKQKVINPDGSEAVDGLKTGYIDAGGSSVVLTGKRGSARAVVVVLGSNTARERDDSASRLLSDALSALSW